MRFRPVLLIPTILLCVGGFGGVGGNAEARAIAPLTDEGLPNVQSGSAFVIDFASGEVLYDRNSKATRPIASTGKVFVALLVRKFDIDLNAVTVITSQDAALAKGGARTRLLVGHGFRNIDLLRAMLIASDNRAPSALGRAIGLSPSELIAGMNALAKNMGLKHTKFTDCSGLNGNVSTAREMSVALQRAVEDPVLAQLMTTKAARVVSHHKRPRAINYRNTNRSLHNNKYSILAGKTGFTTAAGYCLLVVTELDGRKVGMVFLGSRGKLTRFGDFARVWGWLKATPIEHPDSIASPETGDTKSELKSKQAAS